MNKERNRVAETPYGKIIANNHDLYISRSIINGGYYEIDGIKSLVSLIEETRRFENPQILDIGANIGTHALAYCQIRGAEVHSFEAQRAVFYMLAGTLALNGIDNVWVHHRAVSDRTGEWIEFDRPNYDSAINIGGFELLPPHHSDGGTLKPTDEKERVQTMRIDDLGLDRVTYAKIDIEGMEAECLEGMRETIKRCRPVLVIECFKADPARIFKILTELGYGWETHGVDLWCRPSE